MSQPTFAALATAAYCPRQLYYRRRADDWSIPPTAESIRELAFRYDQLIRLDDDALAATAIAVEPDAWRQCMARTAETVPAWAALCDPPQTDQYLEGKDCRGVADKVLDTPLGISLVSPGTPPRTGAWQPQRVRAVAAAKALAWERQCRVEHAYVEYPAYGAVRRVPLDGRCRAEYRRVLQAVRTMDGVPPRLTNRSKCTACEYRTTCGVRTWTLRTLLG